MRSDDALLLDMLIAARKLLRYIGGLSEQEFQANELVQSAVIREFQVLGEAARLISADTKQRHDHLPWRVIAGMRNRLIHEYFDIRYDVVWDTVLRDIPALIPQLEALVPPETSSGDSDGGVDES